MKYLVAIVAALLVLVACGSPSVAAPTAQPATPRATPKQAVVVVTQVVTVVTTPTPDNPTALAQTSAPAATTPSTDVPAPTAPPTTVPSATPLPILCQADWSNGNGGWGTPQGWRISGGMLFTDGKSDTFLLKAPCTLTTPDYAVEAEIEAIPTSCVTGAFGLTARSAYMGGYIGCYTLGI